MINRGSLYYGLLCPSYKLEGLSGVLCSHKFQEEALCERRPTKGLQWDNTSRSWYYMTLPSLCNLTLDCVLLSLCCNLTFLWPGHVGLSVVTSPQW